MSDSRAVKAYQGERTRARGARGGGGAQGEMEWSTASWGGGASQLRRGSVAELRGYGCCCVAGARETARETGGLECGARVRLVGP